MKRKPRAANAYADIDAPLRPLPMAEALEFWRSKVPLSPREFYKLAEQYRVRAFTVSRLARADMLGEIFQSIEKALDEGVSFGAWKKPLAPIWAENGWTGKAAWRVDNIFRTNIQTAYNVGRYKQMQAVAKARPFWQYSAVNDSRTRPTHRALHGRVYRHDSPFWDTFYPPNGFRCRCKVKTLSERQVRERGLTVREGNGLGELIEPVGPDGPMPARPLMPDRGFEGNPGKEAWTPDLSRYPEILREKLEQVVPAAPVPQGAATTGEGALKVPAFKSVKEAEAWAVTNDLVDHADFSGAKIEVVTEWLQSLADHVREFPALRQNQKFVGTCQAQISRWRKLEVEDMVAKLKAANPDRTDDFTKMAERYVPNKKVPSQTLAFSWSQKNVSGVSVNKRWAANPDEFKDALNRSVEANFHPVGCDTIRSVVDHELGHQLDQLLGLRVDREIMEAYKEAASLGMKEQVSTYAGTNVAEFIAECWAEGLNNQNPREYARRISSIIRSRYADKHP